MPNPDSIAPQFSEAERSAAGLLIELALNEDLNGGIDVTSAATIADDAVGTVEIVSRERGVIAGLPAVELVASAVCDELSVTLKKSDGDRVEPGTVVATVQGPVRELLTAERTILNFLTHLSGIATLTAQFAEQIVGTNAVILDTRKTLPGWRVLAKRAVRAGGGTNHRMGLFDAVLIKDNHIAGWREQRADQNAPLADLVDDVRNPLTPGTVIEIEVDTLDQLRDVLPASPEIVLLDNMSNASLVEAVGIRNALSPATLLEASGGVTLETVRGIAETGVDRISVGALTHSAKNFDLGFDWQEQ